MTAPDPRPGPPPPKAPAPPIAAPGTTGRAGTSQHDALCICNKAGSRPVWCECHFIAEVRKDERARTLAGLRAPVERLRIDLRNDLGEVWYSTLGCVITLIDRAADD